MIIYDEETYPNFFSLVASSYDRDDMFVWEISDRKNNFNSLINWMMFIKENKIEMIGFNNLHFDYPILHLIYSNVDKFSSMNGSELSFELYKKADSIIKSNDQFAHTIWENNRFVPQIDLFKIWHFDNQAKRQSLKGLQFNMRSQSVEDLPVKPGTYLTSEQMDINIHYNKHDVSETKSFARISMEAIEFRRSLRNRIEGDILNFNDTKIGKQLLIQQLGKDVCYERVWIDTGFNSEGYYKNQPRQTPRTYIPLKDVIFPYIKFNHPEFIRIHQWMLAQTLEPSDIDDDRASTKGVFKDVKASIDGFDFHFGTGGIHGSVSTSVYHSDDESVIIDADVASLYPTIAIVNRLYPEHLGEKFVYEYEQLKKERFKHAKGTPENASLKLALNGAYGDSNNVYSPLYDPKFTMDITINGQLMLCMFAEQLMNIPNLKIIQINTDGITVKIHRSQRPLYEQICKNWEKFTCLDLEFVDYESMWIRDVNNYIAKDIKGKLKTKGAYWFPDPCDYEKSITNQSPPAWHKDLSSPVVAMAALYEMVHNVPVETFLRAYNNKFDFMLRAKAPRGSQLFIGEKECQRITRYYMTIDGDQLKKISPPVDNAVPGAYKKKNGITWHEYNHIAATLPPDTWDDRIHTKNKSRYEDRTTNLQSGWKVSECNNADNFDWKKLNYDWYIQEAKKLVISS